MTNPGTPPPGQPPYPPQGPGYPPPQPGYGYPAPQPAKKGGISKVVLIIGGIVAAVLVSCCAFGVILARAGGGSNGNGSRASGSQTTHYKVGDQVKAGDAFVVTANSVRSSSGDTYFKPKSGNVFMIIDVTIKNTSGQQQSVSSLLSFALKDSTGQQYTETIVSGATPPDGKIEAGGVLRGQIAYEVPKTQHDSIFSFDPNVIVSDQYLWDLHM